MSDSKQKLAELGILTNAGLIQVAREIQQKALSDGPYKELLGMLADALEQSEADRDAALSEILHLRCETIENEAHIRELKEQRPRIQDYPDDLSAEEF